MENALTIERFCAEPVDRWVSAGSALVFALTDELVGLTLWGSAVAHEVSDTLRALDACKRHHIGPHFNLLIDASRFEGLDGATEQLLAGWVGREAELVQRVRRMAIVRPQRARESKLRELGAALGTLPMYRVVGTLGEALFALGGREDAAAEIDACTEGLLVIPSDVRRLRQLLTNDASVTLEQAARSLELSTRGLNRSLSEIGSTFNDEVKNIRYRTACYLLEITDDDPATIANSVGLTEASLNQLFKEKARTTPMGYRDQVREQY